RRGGVRAQARHDLRVHALSRQRLVREGVGQADIRNRLQGRPPPGTAPRRVPSDARCRRQRGSVHNAISKTVGPMTTTIRPERVTLPMARLGKPSNLPRFRWQQPMPNRETPPNFGLTEEESRHGFNWGEDSILPYQVSDYDDREGAEGSLDCAVIEDGLLRPVIAPSLGGRHAEDR